MYKVIERFADLQDGKHIYVAGDTFPRNGLKITGDRIAQLASCDNRIGRPVIKYVPDKEKSSPAKIKNKE